MPNYTYLCPKGHKTERKADRKQLAIRCKCGKLAERAIISVPVIRFQGPGFTKTSA